MEIKADSRVENLHPVTMAEAGTNLHASSYVSIESPRQSVRVISYLSTVPPFELGDNGVSCAFHWRETLRR